MKTKCTTLRDVAREAGVSYQTVSRVINNHENVSAKTKVRVQKAIDKLGFRVNRAAQIMQTKRSNTIEAIIFNAGFNLFLHEMARAMQKSGYLFSIATIKDDEFETTLANASSRFVDGLILITDKPMSEDYEQLSAMCNGIPFVQVGAKLGAKLPSILYDNAQGARLATEHLIELGHQKIVEISGPLQNADGNDRHMSWQWTMQEHGLDTSLSVEGNYSIEGGYDAMKRLLQQTDDFTAVFAANDAMAFGANTALRERGLRVPDDISVVGYDDVPEAAHFVPALTTVRQDFQLIGRLVVDYILEMVNDPKTPIHQRVLQPELVIRESTRRIT